MLLLTFAGILNRNVFRKNPSTEHQIISNRKTEYCPCFGIHAFRSIQSGFSPYPEGQSCTHPCSASHYKMYGLCYWFAIHETTPLPSESFPLIYHYDSEAGTVPEWMPRHILHND